MSNVEIYAELMYTKLFNSTSQTQIYALKLVCLTKTKHQTKQKGQKGILVDLQLQKL